MAKGKGKKAWRKKIDVQEVRSWSWASRHFPLRRLSAKTLLDLFD
jgi:hypothetical protein